MNTALPKNEVMGSTKVAPGCAVGVEMRSIKFDQRSVRPYEHLEPLVDFLLDHGNKLARDYRWGENRTGYFCLLVNPLDFDLIESEFLIPSYIRLVRNSDAIECDKSWVTIQGAIPQK